MRTLTPAQKTILEGEHFRATARVLVKDAAGSFQDLSTIGGRDWVMDVQWDEDVDQPVSQASVKLWRESSKTQSLSPMMAASLLNRITSTSVNGTSSQIYAPLLDAGREIKIEVATVAVGAQPASTDWNLVFHGDVDEVDWGKSDSRVSLTARDLGGRLLDRYIETARDYVPDPAAAQNAGKPAEQHATPVETVMQKILDDNLGAGVVSLHTPTSPLWNIKKFRREPGPLLDGLRELASQIGWDVRYRWDNGTKAFRLTLIGPNRLRLPDQASSDWTVQPWRYLDVTTLRVNRTGVRNVVRVEYGPANARAKVEVLNQASIDRYGRRFMQIVEDSDPRKSQINDATEADRLAKAALDDLKEPKAEQEVEMHLFWPAQLNDQYWFKANQVHYDSDQPLTVISVRHSISYDQQRTTLTTRGNAIGAFREWLRREVRFAGAPDQPLQWRASVSEDASGTVGTLRISTYDPDATLARVEFYVSAGGGARTGPLAADRASAGVWEKDVTLHEERASTIEPVLTLASGQVIQPGAETFDAGNLPTVLSVVPDVNESGGVSAVVRGDSDTKSFRVLARKDRNPTVAEVRAATLSAGSAREVSTGSLITLAPGETAYVGALAYAGTAASGGGAESSIAYGTVRRSERIPPSISPRSTINANRDRADVTATVDSQAGEKVRLHLKEDDLVATWSLVTSQTDVTPLFVASGTAIGPNHWFYQGTGTPEKKLSQVVLVRDQVKRLTFQAEAEGLGARSTWVPLVMSSREEPWLESVDLTFDETVDRVRLTAVAGPFTQSVRFEVSESNTFSTNLLPAGTWDKALTPGNSTSVELDVSARRDRVLYGRATPWNGPLAGTPLVPTGIAGKATQDSEYVPASETGTQPPTATITHLSGNATTETYQLGGALGAGGTAPLQWRYRVVTMVGTTTAAGGWTAWSTAAFPASLPVARHARNFQELQLEVRDSATIPRMAYARVRIEPSLEALGPNGKLATTVTLEGSSRTLAMTDLDARYGNGRRGPNLIANGDAEDGTNFNFTSIAVVSGGGATGGYSFERTGPLTFISDEFVPVDTAQQYLFSLQARGVAGVPRLYSGIACYDKDKRAIGVGNVWGPGNLMTTLAADAVQGTTTVVLTDATNWGNDTNSYIAFGALDDGSDRPNYNVFRYTSRSGNTLTMSPALAQTWPAGTKVRFHRGGSTYNYIGAVNATLPMAWTQYQGTIQGENAVGEYLENKFRYGTQYVKVAFLANYAGTANETTQLDRIELFPLQFIEQAPGVVSGKTGYDRVTSLWKANGKLLKATTVEDPFSPTTDRDLGDVSRRAQHGLGAVDAGGNGGEISRSVPLPRMDKFLDLNGGTGRIATVGGMRAEQVPSGLSGAQLCRNPDFLNGLDGYYVYNNSGGNAVQLFHENDAHAPNTSGKRMRVNVNGTPTNPGRGGFYLGLNLTDGAVQPGYYRRGAEIVFTIRAWIPVGMQMEWASNGVGDGSSLTWLTAQAGKAAWETYVCRLKVGVTGGFSSTGFFWIDGPSAFFDWYVAMVDAIDVTAQPTVFAGANLRASTGGRLTDTDIVTSQGTSADTSTVGGRASAVVRDDSIVGRSGIGATPENVIRNGGGQDGESGQQAPSWSYGSGVALLTSTTFSRFGDRSLVLLNDSYNNSWSYQQFSVNAGDVLEISAWIRVPALGAASGQAVLNLDAPGNDVTVLEASAPYANGPDIGVPLTQNWDWTMVRALVRVNQTGTATLYVQNGYQANSWAHAYFDGVTVRKVTRYQVEGRRRIDSLYESDGRLRETVKQFEGLREVRLAQFAQYGKAHDGKQVGFSPHFQNIPVVMFGPGQITYDPTLGNLKQRCVAEAVGLTASGFTARLRIRQAEPAVSTATLYPSNGVCTKGPADEAYDDAYTYNYSVSINSYEEWVPGNDNDPYRVEPL